MQALLAQLKSLPPAVHGTIRFFDRKDFFSVYGEDAEFVADTFNKTRATVKYLSAGEGGGAGLASQTVTARLLPDMLKKLVRELNLSFEIWGQKQGGWELTSKGSPGNFDEGEFGGDEDEANIGPGLMAALHVGKDASGLTVVGIAFVDVLRSCIGLAQFTDVDTLANAETALVQLGCSECVVPKSGARGSSPSLPQMLARADIAATERQSKDFAGGAPLFSELQRLLDPSHHSVKVEMLPEMLDEHAVAALAGLLRSLDLLSNLSAHGKFRLSGVPLDHCMRLDSAAMAALNLLPSAQDAHKGTSLFGRFSCKTAMGSRKLMSWIRQPLLDVSLINGRLDVVEGLVQDSTLRAALSQELLKGLPDIQRLLLKFQRNTNKATLQDVVKLYQAVQTLPRVAESVASCSSAALRERFQGSLVQLVSDFANLCNMVECTLDLEALGEEGAFRLRPSFDERLQVLHAALAAQRKVLKAEQARAGGWAKKVELEDKKGHGWVLRCSKQQEKGVKDSAKKDGVELTEVSTSKGGFLFRTPKMDKAAREHAELEKEYGDVQKELVSQLMSVVQGYSPAIELLGELLSDLDVYAALACTAVSSPLPYSRPVVTEGGDTVLKQCRHPCLEAADVTFIPNDVRLQRGTREVCILTGPNMGGKSTYIRSAALSVLMAQIGSFVPCLAATVSVADAILCRVGAADSQARGVSTFMAEMLEMAQMLRLATSRSLLVVDELGRGTSTYDGFGLACAIAEHLAVHTRAFCFFATHFHELTELARSLPTVCNLHVTARTDAAALVLLYEVRDGPCDQSFGIHVAELAKFPPRVLAMARRKAAQLERFGEQQHDAVAAESPLKRGKVDVEEGGKLVEGFLEQTRKLQEEQRGGDALPKMRALLSQLLAKNNGYVNELVEKAQQK